MAIIVIVAVIVSCGHKANQSGVVSPDSGVQPAPTTDPRLTALQEYAASLPPVTGQTLEPIWFGEPQPDGTYLKDGRKMKLGEILASAPKVACPPLAQIRLGGNTVKSSASDKTASGIGDLINPPQFGPVIPGPFSWNPPPNLGDPGPIPPPIIGGPLPPGPFHYEGEGVGPLYDPNPIIYGIPDGPPVDVGIVRIGGANGYPALVVLTRHTIWLIIDPLMLSGAYGGDRWGFSSRVAIPVPSQVTTLDISHGQIVKGHTVDGAYGVRLRVTDLNNDGRDDLVIVTNWDDPAWPKGANEFGWNGTWIYYQNRSGSFDPPFSPGGASREYDVARYNSAFPIATIPSPLPDLIGIQNPHVASKVPLPGMVSDPYPSECPWDGTATEYYDHVQFRDAGPAENPWVNSFLIGNFASDDLLWCSSIDETNANGDPLDDEVLAWRLYLAENSTTYNFVYICLGLPYQLEPTAFGFDTVAAAFRARPGRFEPNEGTDDYASTFPSANSLQIMHRIPVASLPFSYKSELYSPLILLRNASGIDKLTAPKEVQVADLDSDGLSDLVVLNDNRLYVLQNLGARTFIVTDEFAVQDDAQRAAIGPLFGGSEKDIAAIDSPISSVRVYRPISK